MSKFNICRYNDWSVLLNLSQCYLFPLSASFPLQSPLMSTYLNHCLLTFLSLLILKCKEKKVTCWAMFMSQSNLHSQCDSYIDRRTTPLNSFSHSSCLTPLCRRKGSLQVHPVEIIHWWDNWASPNYWHAFPKWVSTIYCERKKLQESKIFKWV